jgi:hypothetical protein
MRRDRTVFRRLAKQVVDQVVGDTEAGATHDRLPKVASEEIVQCAAALLLIGLLVVGLLLVLGLLGIGGRRGLICGLHRRPYPSRSIIGRDP